MQLGVIEVPTLQELFVDRIEDEILSGKLKVGDSLPSERQLQEETHISKSVIHAGLVELEEKGFVEIIPRKGTVVANYEETGTVDTLNTLIRKNGGNMTEKQTKSFLDARIALEGSAIRLLAEKADEKDIEVLKEKLAVAQEIASQKEIDTDALAAALYDYHRTICLRSGNEFFPLLLNEFKPIIMGFWVKSILTFGAESNVHLASRYLDFISAHDPEGAYNRLVRSVNEYLNYCTKQ